MNDWCLSNGFDYVDMNEKTETPMDKVGIALALEILQTNLWDGMIRKDKGGMTEREEELELIRGNQGLIEGKYLILCRNSGTTVT